MQAQTHVKKISVSRLDFMRGLGAAGVVGVLDALPTVAAETPNDWKAAFVQAGFDPSAPGCATFVVIGDPHVPWRDTVAGKTVGDGTRHLEDRIATWNAMAPRPLAVLAMGDQVSTVSAYMGDRTSIRDPVRRAQAASDIRLVKSLFDQLEVPFYHTVGNHDCYPGEVNAAFYAAHYAGWKPYERFELGGATFINLCGGHDGAIEPGQRAWLAAEAASIPKDRMVFLMAHYPNVGVGRVDGYDIGVVIRTFFSNRSADTWLLAGHNHGDEIRRYSLPGGGRLYVATHVREPFGYWIYGLRNGRLVARVLVPFDGKTGRTRQSAERGLVGEAVQDGGPLLLPFEQEGEKLLWRQFLGQAGDERCRVSIEDSQADAGSYFFYVGTVIYRLPLKEARGATRFGIYGRMTGHHATHAEEPLAVSPDGQTWTPIENPWRNYLNTCYAVEIPKALRGGDALYVRIGGFGFEGNSSLAGFALLA